MGWTWTAKRKCILRTIAKFVPNFFALVESLLFNMRRLPLCRNTSKTTYCEVNSIYEWIFSNREYMIYNYMSLIRLIGSLYIIYVLTTKLIEIIWLQRWREDYLMSQRRATPRITQCRGPMSLSKSGKGKLELDLNLWSSFGDLRIRCVPIDPI